MAVCVPLLLPLEQLDKKNYESPVRGADLLVNTKIYVSM